MSPAERKSLIHKDHSTLSLTRQCRLLKISRSSLYYTPVGIDAATLKLMYEIDRIFTRYPFLAAVRLQPICPETASTRAATVCAA